MLVWTERQGRPEENEMASALAVWSSQKESRRVWKDNCGHPLTA